MKTINLERSPMLATALDFIAEHPGCSKRDVILGINGGAKPASKTYASQNKRIGDLVTAGLVENRGTGNAYELHATEAASKSCGK